MAWEIRVFLIWIFFAGFHKTIFGQDTTRNNSYAVVVGISQYQNPNMPRLQFSDKDATLFAAHLQSKAGGNVPASHIRLLVNETATIAAIYDALNWLQENCGANDKAYFYFSGHGDIETPKDSSLGYLLAYNSPPNNYRNNAITIKDLNEAANQLSSKSNATVVLVTDACHSGELAGDYYKGKQLVASQLRLILNNEIRLAACGVDEKAAEGDDWGGGRGVFSYYLLQGLNGMADLNKNDTIQLRELKRYLDSTLTTDKVLIRNAHKQHPALDGNPQQTMAVLDPSFLQTTHSLTSDIKSKGQFGAVLSIFKPLGKQPVDYLFELMKTKAIESKLPFSEYKNTTKDSLPLKIVNDCIAYQDKLNQQKDSLQSINDYVGSRHFFANTDTLQLLKNQLLNSKTIVNSFNEQFIQVVHGQAQDMVNAYLEGDLAELEKRQYYYDGERKYGDFVNMLRVALQIAPQQHYLYNLLKVQVTYISGLIARMEMATASSRNASVLLTRAIDHQQEALKLESFAAFVYNEMGNLYVHKKKYKLAERHFNIASELSPTWAIPWSNKIRLGLVTDNLENAVRAVRMADSLQHDLSYTFMNAGLVMSKHGDLLAAESYYHKAITTNTKHFLPYENLGTLYTATGDYEKADSFLTEASIRKRGFSINMASFDVGIGNVIMAVNPGKWYQCDMFQNVRSGLLEPYVRLVNALMLSQSSPDSALRIMTAIYRESGDLPLLKHYSGKLLFSQQKWKEAELFLLQAIQSYKSDSAFITFLEHDLKAKTEADTCLLVRLKDYHYDIIEDHYLLAAIYEHLGVSGKVIEQYAIISDIENEMQMDQATFRGAYALRETNRGFLTWEGTNGTDALHDKYEKPRQMGGYLRMAGIYEKSGDYISAEKVYLRQIELNQEAGNSRIAQANRGPFHFKGSHTYYRIAVNRLTEAATFDFYQRMLRVFPRDAEWQEKSGMFLYQRLSVAFQKVPGAKYHLAYENIKKYAYPFTVSNQSFLDQPGEEQKALISEIHLPGTGQIIVIPTPKYDPLKESLENLKLAVRLSGELQTKPEILKAIADLNSWMDNRKEAFGKYKELIRAQEPDAQLRSKIIDYCFVINEPAFAMEQLDVLYGRGQASPAQVFQLADCYARGGLPEKALMVLKSVKTENKAERTKSAMLYAKINWLNGREASAIGYLNSIPVEGAKEISADHVNKFVADRYYTIARLNASLRKKEEAFAALAAALENGFAYAHVLDADPAWHRLRQSKRWKNLMQQYSSQIKAFDPEQKGDKTDSEIREYMIAD